MARNIKRGASKADKKSLPGRLRIVAGNWRSRLLEITDEQGLRPTSERIRETLFNWLAPRIAGARCLDLFAGTGALGLEALSRGAASAVFVEKSQKAAEVLQRNIATLDATGATVHVGDAFDYLQHCESGPFDIVFLDPPFAADILDDLCRLLDQGTLLADRARVYIEDNKANPKVKLPAGWQTVRSKEAGNVRYSLVQPGSAG